MYVALITSLVLLILIILMMIVAVVICIDGVSIRRQI